MPTMVRQDETTKTTGVSDAEARCTEAPSPSLREWIGSGAGLMSKEAVSSFDEPTWPSDDREQPPSAPNAPLV